MDATALAYFAGFFAALFLAVAAHQWWQVAKVKGPDLNAYSVRHAAFATVMAFAAVSLSILAVVLPRLW